MPINTPKRALPKPESSDNVLEYSAGTIAGGGLHTALNTLDDVLLDSDATAKGQLFVADGAGSVTVLDPGADGEVLTADSGAPEGVSWQSASPFVLGADVASAATITLPATGNQFNVTGTTPTTALTAIPNAVVTLKAVSAGWKLAHNGTTINLSGGHDFWSEAKSRIVLWCDGTNWYELARTHPTTKMVSSFTAPVTTTTAGTDYDGPSVPNVPAGTWLLTGSVSVTTPGTGPTARAQLLYGATVAASAAQGTETGPVNVQLPLSAVVTLTATTTCKIQVAQSVNGGTINAASPYAGVGNNASVLTATRIA